MNYAPLLHHNLFDAVDTQATCGFLAEFLDRVQGGNKVVAWPLSTWGQVVPQEDPWYSFWFELECGLRSSWGWFEIDKASERKFPSLEVPVTMPCVPR